MHSDEELKLLVRRCDLEGFTTSVKAENGAMLQSITFTTTSSIHSSLIDSLKSTGFNLVFIIPVKKARIYVRFEKELTSQNIIENEVETS